MIGSIIFLVLSVLFCVAFCYFRAHKATVYSLALKAVASFCFIMCALFALKTLDCSTSIGLLIVAGLTLGLIGDILLDLKIMYPQQANQYFVAGTSAFALGHCFYFLAVVLFNSEVCPRPLPWNILSAFALAILLTWGIMLLSKKMGMNFGKMLYVVILYSVVLSFMMCYSVAVAIFSPIFWIFAGGMITFMLSDLVLSMQYFGGKHEKVWIYLNHILYYIAQCALAFSILYICVA